MEFVATRDRCYAREFTMSERDYDATDGLSGERRRE